MQEKKPLSSVPCFCSERSDQPATVSSCLCLASSMERKTLRRYPASPKLEVSSVHLQNAQGQERTYKSLIKAEERFKIDFEVDKCHDQ